MNKLQTENEGMCKHVKDISKIGLDEKLDHLTLIGDREVYVGENLIGQRVWCYQQSVICNKCKQRKIFIYKKI